MRKKFSSSARIITPNQTRLLSRVTSALRVAFFGSGAHRSPSAAAATSGSRARGRQPDHINRTDGTDGAGLDVQWEERAGTSWQRAPASRQRDATPRGVHYSQPGLLGWDLGWYGAGEPGSHGSCLSAWPTSPLPPRVQVFFFSVQNPKC